MGTFVSRSEFTLRAGPYVLSLGPRTLVMGILNCTPDSFYDGGLHQSAESALRRLEEIEEEGADLIDLGGESSRPGAEPVSESEEWERIAPVLREARRRRCPLPISVDTVKAAVAHRALDEGASLINDISGLAREPGLADLAARYRAGLVLMHMQGEPRTMQVEPSYGDVTREVGARLSAAADLARSRGVERDSILLDPGIGFGKTVLHNLTLLRELPNLSALGYPLLIGASRKSFLGKILDLPAADRLEASLAAHVAASLAGAHMVRVHDVRATWRAIRIADAIRAGAIPPTIPRTSGHEGE